MKVWPAHVGKNLRKNCSLLAPPRRLLHLPNIEVTDLITGKVILGGRQTPASPLTPDFQRVRLYPMFVTRPPGMSISLVPVSESNPVFSMTAVSRGFPAEQSEFPRDLSKE